MNKFMYMFSKHFSTFPAALILLLVVLGCNSKSDADWTKTLGNKKLSAAKTSGSISDKINIWFCPSGEYAKQTQFSGFSTGGGGTLSVADEDFEFGKWSVESETLILRSQDGKTSRYDISQGMDEEVISLDGDGFLVSRHNECVGQ